MRQRTAPHADEALPYSAQDEQPKLPRGRWRRKRVLMPSGLLLTLVLFGIIFGAVYGTKTSSSNEARSTSEELFAAQGFGNTSSSSRRPTPTSYSRSTGHWNNDYVSSYSSSSSYPYSSSAGHWNNDYVSTYSSSSSYPYPTPGPPQSGGILRPQGKVPRDISGTVGAPGSLLWGLGSDNQLYRAEQAGSWEAYPDRKFLFTPVTVSTGDAAQIAVSVDAVSGRIVYMHFHDGQWDSWQELEFTAQFLRRPAVISRAAGKADIINIDNNGHVWIVSYDGTEWSKWTEIGDKVNSEVAATTWGEDRIDVFAKQGEHVLHKHWSSGSGWAEAWEDLGDPWSAYYHEPGETSGSPLAVSWLDGEDGVIDVYMTYRGNSHKMFRNGAWSEWVGISASHEGYEFIDTQSIVRADGQEGRPFAHLISRGTDDGIHYIAHDGADWGSWTYAWLNLRTSLDYPTQYMATFIAGGGNGNIVLVAKDLEGNVLRREVAGTGPEQWASDSPWEERNKAWENWSKPPGGFVDGG